MKFEVDVEFLASGDRFRLLEDLNVDVGRYHFTVPKGYVSNGASVPKFFTRLLPRIGDRYFVSSIAHDYLYEYGLYDKKTSDYLLYKIARMNNTSLWKCCLLWLGVFLGGYPTWRKYRNKKKRKFW